MTTELSAHARDYADTLVKRWTGRDIEIKLLRDLANALDACDREADRLRESYDDVRALNVQISSAVAFMVSEAMIAERAAIWADLEAARTIGCDVLPMCEVTRVIAARSCAGTPQGHHNSESV